MYGLVSHGLIKLYLVVISGQWDTLTTLESPNGSFVAAEYGLVPSLKILRHSLNTTKWQRRCPSMMRRTDECQSPLYLWQMWLLMLSNNHLSFEGNTWLTKFWMTIPFIPDECYITYDIHTMALRELENINMMNFGFLSFVKVSHVTVWKSQLHHCNVHKNNFFTDLNTLVQVVTQLGEIVKEWRKRAEYSQVKKMNRNKKMKIDYDKQKSVFNVSGH